MKVRVGFVSNSSSVSFVVDKADMTQEQIRGFRELIEGGDHYETCVQESSKHFFGSLSQNHRAVWDFIRGQDPPIDIETD